MEHVSLALNPRAPLYKDRSLIQIALESRNASAIAEHRRLLAEHLWALYRVRRIYTAKGRANRAVERLEIFPDEAAARQALGRMEAERASDHDRNGEFLYLWRLRREENVYPSREEFFTIAPRLKEGIMTQPLDTALLYGSVNGSIAASLVKQRRDAVGRVRSVVVQYTEDTTHVVNVERAI
ncbi:MAG: hypothetical protein ACRD7E_20645 [Bryobacteraceae bacterium]